jgi:hypothetical protein
MSVDLVNPPAGSSTFPGSSIPGLVNDLIVIYGGWGGLGRVEPLHPGPGTSTSRLLRDVQDLPGVPGHRRPILALEGSLSSSAGVDQGVTFIRDNFHPYGQLIIYGYSAGGTDALALCRAINRDLAFFGFGSKRLVNVFAMEDSMSREVFGAVRVDLLITVDGAAGEASNSLDRSVPACVRRNLNFYQRRPSPIGSHGEPNTPVSPSTNVENNDMTGRAEHATIGTATNGQALDAIRGSLGVEAVPPVTPPGTRGG